MAILLRSTGLAGYENLARSLGLDARRELKRVGLSANMLADPDALIPYVAVVNLLERSAQASNCPDFGLRLSELQGLDILGPVAVLIRNAPTLGEAMQLASQFVFVHSPAIQLDVGPADGAPAFVDLSFGINIPNLPPCAQTCELALGIIIQALRLLGGGTSPPWSHSCRIADTDRRPAIPEPMAVIAVLKIRTQQSGFRRPVFNVHCRTTIQCCWTWRGPTSSRNLANRGSC
ncbi:AraC family transcriptional regulator [Burkholderia stabilis]|uniref:AraC family transcriptional regulator n=1 Tax=Burkholderia stabilis TaxID=95485 RepID=A0A4Q2A634_9BURK|nr:AraC family transcriptional regulator [Burkholderia stabilis]